MSAALSAGVSQGLVVASIPSPSLSGFDVGPLRIHFYALCILAGIAICLWLTTRRWERMGQDPEAVWDIALWAIPFGLVGARAYHVLITDPASYFGPGADPWGWAKIWEGGIGIMGAITVGALGAFIACRRLGVSLTRFADAAAPGILIAQACGRWGNWFNQELFGKPTDLPWGLEISQNSVNFPSQYPPGTLFHPTFLYESLWNLLGAMVLLFVGRRWALKLGQTFWLYVLWYGVGRFMIEMFLRIDAAQTLGGLRIHIWTSGALILLGLLGFLIAGARKRKSVAVREGE
ncbi:prolipoprotein diacylglyceryl transferase [Rothia sp. LK2588]|uniref:prolipoprotein diacylglyceryl transferase n=1 Tax=Rothia sp. LK2588 TaxID=3114369 RepID=UPI0034CF7B4D